MRMGEARETKRRQGRGGGRHLNLIEWLSYGRCDLCMLMMPINCRKREHVRYGREYFSRNLWAT